MKKTSFILAVLLLLVVLECRAQEPPCLPGYGGTVYRLGGLDSIPVPTTSMPTSVAMAYLIAAGTYADSLNDLWKLSQLFARRTSFDDTTRKMLRYFYEMVDFNPALYARTANITTASGTRIPPRAADIKILDAIAQTSPHPVLDYTLARSSYIMHIKANWVTTQTDTAIPKHFPVEVVTAQIIDRVKGKVIPTCLGVAGAGHDDHPSVARSTAMAYATLVSADSGTCFQFHYAPSWGGMINPDGSALVQGSKEYIVFLDLVPLCADNSGLYFSLRPAGSIRGIYPIDSSGHVVDPYDDFGFGTGLTATQFKTKLRDRIQVIGLY